MKEYNIGEKIKELRLSLEISQNDLAKQICEPQDLEKIEKGDEYPTLPQLHTLAKRLGIPITYFFETNWNQNVDYVNSVKTLMRNYVRDREYKALYEIVKREEESELFQDKLNKQFLMWHEGICIHYLFNNKNEALNLLHEAINLTNKDLRDLKEEEIKIYYSIGVIHYDNKEYEKSLDIHKQILSFLQDRYEIQDRKLYLRVLFALAQTLIKLKDFENALRYSNLGIGVCISEDLLYLFGEFYYQSGLSLVKLDSLGDGMELLNKSMNIFSAQRNRKMEELVKEDTLKLLEPTDH
ncbi:helix-turn-helix domain-containing protein [Priestia koreensis]|uniref:helix-turn-helix domain-containing protein n=1 Tax=Priestia koreensis TaxID=284581 RepID=UPI00203B805D|nr:helix-turn-helix domain-containing protein [Priestia koreensis]MCM3007084.1 helix-turn-helix transcriptional regulator [Priestia koreensis]